MESRAKEICIFALQALNANEIDLAKKASTELFTHFYPTEIPDYLRHDFFAMLLDHRLFPDKYLSFINFKHHYQRRLYVDRAQYEIFSIISELKEPSLKQDALLHTLMPQTFLGTLLDVHTLYSMQIKLAAASLLEKEILLNGPSLPKETKHVLENDDRLTVRLQNIYPTLYEALGMPKEEPVYEIKLSIQSSPPTKTKRSASMLSLLFKPQNNKIPPTKSPLNTEEIEMKRLDN